MSNITNKPANIDTLLSVIFDPTVMPKKVNQAEGQDLIVTSSTNIYEGVTQPRSRGLLCSVEGYYRPHTHILRIEYAQDQGQRQGCRAALQGGRPLLTAIERIVSELNKAAEYAENPAQKAYIKKLVEFYTTGDLKAF